MRRLFTLCIFGLLTLPASAQWNTDKTGRQPLGGGGAVSSVFGRTGVVAAAANDYSWTQIASKPATFPPSAHTHDWTADITGKPSIFPADWSGISNKPATFPSDWSTLGSKPSTFPPSAHTHIKADITDFGTYEAPLTFSSPFSRSVNTISCLVASGSQAGCLASGDWSTFNGKQAALGFTPENSANKGAANGYAGLDASTLVPVAQIPALAESKITNLTTDLAAKETTANKGAANGYAGLDASTLVPVAQIPALAESKITNLTTDLAAKETTANKGAANGYASLDASTLVPVAQIPALAESKITNLTTDLAAKEATANKNAASGYAGLSASSLLTASQVPWATPGAIGGTTPAAGAFTTLSASSTVSGAGFSTYLASPPAIGSTTPAAGKFTTLTITNLLVSNAAPTISSGFGTSPSVSSNNGTAAFRVNVGTGGTATSGVIGLATAPNGWNCWCNDITTNSTTIFLCKQTASSTTTATIGNFNDVAVAAAWGASNILAVSCFAF
jgi:hypothetical protein